MGAILVGAVLLTTAVALPANANSYTNQLNAIAVQTYMQQQAAQAQSQQLAAQQYAAQVAAFQASCQQTAALQAQQQLAQQQLAAQQAYANQLAAQQAQCAIPQANFRAFRHGDGWRNRMAWAHR